MNPLDDVTASAESVDPRADVMRVGHLPFMSRLTAYPTAGSVETPAFKCRNGGILCLGKDPETSFWMIR